MVAVTDWNDPNYTDICVNTTGSPCDYCCLISTASCSRDIRACEPVYDRGTFNVYLLLIFVGSVVCGCPAIIFLLRILVDVRFCKKYYKTTNGISCLEVIVKCCCFCCCNFKRIWRKQNQDQLFGMANDDPAQPNGDNQGDQNLEMMDLNGNGNTEDVKNLVEVKPRPQSSQKRTSKQIEVMKLIDIEKQPLTFDKNEQNTTSNLRGTTSIENTYKDDLWENAIVETEIFETPGREQDFDQINEENMTYSRYAGTSHQQQSQNIISDEIDPKKSMTTFNKIAEDNDKERFQIKRSRQAQISNRVMRIKEEIYKLEKELNQAQNLQNEQSSQGEDAKIEPYVEESAAQSKDNAAQSYIQQLDQIKNRLQKAYESKGFKLLAKNQQHLKFLSLKNNKRQALDIQNQDGDLDVANLEQIILKLQNQNLNNEGAEGSKEEVKKISLVVDRSKQDIGILIRLYHLQKRISFIKYSNKYKNMTDQIEYVQKRMELLDAQKLQFMQNRTRLLSEEILNLQGNMKEVKEIGHNKEEIEELYRGAIKVKHTMNEIHKYIERLEQKKKIHDMSAKVVMDIQSIEEQQMDILQCVKSNDKLFDYLRDGMQSNISTIKKNLEFLKKKASQAKQ